MGIGMATRWMSGWGLKFFDYDNDGNLDLILANGFPDDLIDQTSSLVKWKEPLLLFHNGGKTFRNVSDESGPVFARNFPARGLALGDFNNDGKVSVLIGTTMERSLFCATRWQGQSLACVNCRSQMQSRSVGARITHQAETALRMKVGGGSFFLSRSTNRSGSWTTPEDRLA
jgi:hypothetical protein